MAKSLILVVALFFSTLIGAQDQAPTNGGNTLDEFFRDKTKIENPLELRDPFKSPPVKAGKRNQDGGRNYYRSGKGEFSNLAEVNSQQLDLYEMKVVGVMIGKERRVMIQAGGNSPNKEVIILKEGAKIGQDNAELKAILPGGIVVVEKIINVYGQEEYLETVIPISR